MKKISSALVLALILPVFANAKTTRKPASDSSWLLCGGKKNLEDLESKSAPVVNIYEHRDGADRRKIEIYWIFGGHLLAGSFDNSEANEGKISLVSVLPKTHETYNGKMKIDFSGKTLSLKGGWGIDGASQGTLDYDLACEAMN